MPVLEYFNQKKGQVEEKFAARRAAKSPILNEEDEKFLTRITSEDHPPPLPERPVVILDNGKTAVGKDAQTALMDGADSVPLPTSPPVEGELKEGKVEGDKEKKKHDYWAYVPKLPPFGKVSKGTSV
jgi:hypothetical protein